MFLGFALFIGFISAIHVHKIIGIWLDVFHVFHRVDKKIMFFSVPFFFAAITVFLMYASETAMIVAFILYGVIMIVSNLVDDARKRNR